MPVRKWCFVPQCTNTTTKTPLKIFVTVPKLPKRRQKWFAAARRDIKEVSLKSTLYCCEDHFDLEKDMENYIEYKLSNGKARMKRDVLPHKFSCQPDKNLLFTKMREPSEKRARKREISDYLHQLEEPSKHHVQQIDKELKDHPEPSTSASSNIRQVCEKTSQTKLFHFRSKSVQTSFKLDKEKAHQTDVAISPIKFLPPPKQSFRLPRKRLRLESKTEFST